jgi:16S rRNA C967 or C1407 C5-methylase (RsmB/RsmF family)/NOL1/NOP2/fmu family ribosome biogenesis protein
MKLPSSFEKYLAEADLNPDEMRRGLQLEPSVFVRMHPKKSNALPHLSPAHPLIPGVYKLPRRPVFALDPWFHAGMYYVQDVSSAFLKLLLADIIKTIKIDLAIDVCAAPGGKSTLLLELLNEYSILIANETIGSRFGILKENLEKWGYPNFILTRLDPTQLGKSGLKAELMLIDAPCSGEGMFRKDPNALNMWSEASVAHCALRQHRIVEDALPALAEGGFLLYSTCTFNRRENEEIILKNSEILEPFIAEFPKLPGMHIREENGFRFYRFLPEAGSGEGLTFCVCRKKGASTSKTPPAPRREKSAFSVINHSDIPSSYILIEDKQGIQHLFPPGGQHALHILEKSKGVASFGTEVSERRNTLIKPLHGATLSAVLPKSTHVVTLNIEEALKYLKRNTFEIDIPLPGLYTASHQGAVLGNIKHLGLRWNNLYPNAYRLRMEIPNEIPEPWWAAPPNTSLI